VLRSTPSAASPTAGVPGKSGPALVVVESRCGDSTPACSDEADLEGLRDLCTLRDGSRGAHPPGCCAVLGTSMCSTCRKHESARFDACGPDIQLTSALMSARTAKAFGDVGSRCPAIGLCMDGRTPQHLQSTRIISSRSSATHAKVAV